MRWIFFSLVVINIGVYIWYSMESDRKARLEQLNQAATSESPAVRGKPLVLTRELTEEEKAELAKQPKGETVPDAVIQAHAPEPVAPQPAPAPSPPVASAAAAPVAAPAEPAPAQVPVVPNQCVRFGPISDKQYDQIAQRLLARSIVPERLTVDIKGKLEYWVVLPPFDDSQTAVRKLQELQGRGVQGQIIPKGELANAIAFGGVFADKATAEQMAVKMRNKGLKVEVRGVHQTQQQKWVSLSERQAPKFSDELWKEIDQDFPRMKKETYFCH